MGDEEPNDSRRWKCVEISLATLETFIRGGDVWVSDLPENAELAGFWSSMDATGPRHFLLFHCLDWDPVPEGGLVPEFQLTCTKIEWRRAQEPPE